MPNHKGIQMKVIDQEFYDTISMFIDNLIVSMPASCEAAINALEIKANDLRKQIKKVVK